MRSIFKNSCIDDLLAVLNDVKNRGKYCSVEVNLLNENKEDLNKSYKITFGNKSITEKDRYMKIEIYLKYKESNKE